MKLGSRSEHSTVCSVGRGNPIPEDVVKDYFNKKHRTTEQTLRTTYRSKMSRISEGDKADSTPTIDAIKYVHKTVFSLISLEFLVGDLDQLQPNR